jgi:hypothetical protein
MLISVMPTPQVATPRHFMRVEIDTTDADWQRRDNEKPSRRPADDE